MNRNTPRSLIPSILLLVLGLFPFAAKGAPSGETAGEPTAKALAEASMEAMGGQEAFAQTRLLRFDFVVSRAGTELARHRHWWDRWSGDYRVEGNNREGQAYRVVFNVNDRKGEAWLDGTAQEGEALEALLEMAYGRFINDTYWLLMPWKWLDPGVQLTLHEPREADGTTFDIVELSFTDGTGLTSGDHYWGWVSRTSHRMERWEYALQTADGKPSDGDPSVFLWTDWVKTDSGLLFSTVKSAPSEGGVAISFPVLETHADVSPEQIETFFATDL
ncbi:MAG: hypothetical protein K8J08_14005 [Thermoanaerobaculia bacterium]|nr:hypothetical protein [Thermoanaerobaculia bacterium]